MAGILTIPSHGSKTKTVQLSNSITASVNFLHYLGICESVVAFVCPITIGINTSVGRNEVQDCTMYK